MHSIALCFLNKESQIATSGPELPELVAAFEMVHKKSNAVLSLLMLPKVHIGLVLLLF